MTIHWTVWFVFSVNTGQEFVSCINATHWSMCLSNHTNLRSALLDMSNFQIGVWQYSNHIWIQCWFKSRVLLTFSAGEQLVFTDGQKVLQLHFSKRKTLLYMYIVKPGWGGGGNKIIPTASQFPWSPGAKPLNKPLQSSYHALLLTSWFMRQVFFMIIKTISTRFEKLPLCSVLLLYPIAQLGRVTALYIIRSNDFVPAY